MSSPEQAGPLVDALRAKNLTQEDLFQTIAALGNCLDRDMVISTMQGVLGIPPVEKDDCVLFDDIVVGFTEDGRLKSLYRIIDGR